MTKYGKIVLWLIIVTGIATFKKRQTGLEENSL